MNYRLQSSKSLLSFLQESYPIESYINEIISVSPDLKAHLEIVKIAISLKNSRARVLDLGAGGLDKILPLAALGFDCFACDDFGDPWHQAALPLIRDIASQNSITLSTASLNDLASNWTLGYYDIIMLNDVIEHLHFSPLSLLQQCLDHLTPGGILLVHVPSCVNIKKRIRCLLGLSIYPAAESFFLWEGQFRGHVREYSRHDLEFLASRLSGITSFNVKSACFMLGVIPRRFRLLSRLVFLLLPSFSDSWQLIVRK